MGEQTHTKITISGRVYLTDKGWVNFEASGVDLQEAKTNCKLRLRETQLVLGD